LLIGVSLDVVILERVTHSFYPGWASDEGLADGSMNRLSETACERSLQVAQIDKP